MKSLLLLAAAIVSTSLLSSCFFSPCGGCGQLEKPEPVVAQV